MRYITNEQEALEAVKQNGFALRYVKEQAIIDKINELL